MNANALLVATITLGAVVLLNLAIIYRFRNRKDNQHVNQIKLLQKATKLVRNPWQKEDQELAELAKLVTGLREEKIDEDKTSESDHQSGL